MASWYPQARTALTQQLRNSDEETYAALLALTTEQLDALWWAADGLRDKCSELNSARHGEPAARHKFAALGLDVPIENNLYNRPVDGEEQK